MTLDTELFFRLSVTGLDFLGYTYDVTIDEGGYVLRAVRDEHVVFMEHCGHTQDEVLANFRKEVEQAAIEHMLGYINRIDSEWKQGSAK